MSLDVKERGREHIKSDPLPPNVKEQNSPISSPCFSYKSAGEKLLRNQKNSPWVIISLIIMTPGAE